MPSLAAIAAEVKGLIDPRSAPQMLRSGESVTGCYGLLGGRAKTERHDLRLAGSLSPAVSRTGDYMAITQSGSSGILYAGSTVKSQWESAYGGFGSRLWQVGEWHLIAYTWSAAANSMRFYVDGLKAADTNEQHYWPPDATGDTFALGADAYLLDEIRILSTAMSADEVRANATRIDPPRNHEVWLPVSDLSPGDSVTLEMGAGCTSQAFVYDGIPISSVDPPSTLLAPGTTSLALHPIGAVHPLRMLRRRTAALGRHDSLRYRRQLT